MITLQPSSKKKGNYGKYVHYNDLKDFSDEIDGDISDYDVPILYIEFGRSL